MPRRIGSSSGTFSGLRFMDAVAEEGLTVVLSSHIIADLERTCDYLVILAQG